MSVKTEVIRVSKPNDAVVILNNKYPDRPSLIKDKFFDYNVYHVCIDGTEMYAVTELLKQYTTINNKPRIKLLNYLQLESTKNYIDMLCKKYCSKNNISSIQNNQEDFTDLHNVWDPRHCETLEKDSSDIESVEKDNSDAKDSDIDFYGSDKPGIIMKFSLAGYLELNTIRETTLMCEKLLTHCLMWLDINFADDIFNFIERLRHQDNNFLKHNLEIVEIENNELKLMSQKQTQLISDIQSKNDELNSKNKELEVVNTRLDSKNKELEITVDNLNSKTKELSKINSTLESKNASLSKINSKLNIRNEELTKINSEINSKNNYLHRINSDLNSKVTELTKLNKEFETTSNKLKSVNTELENTIAMLTHEKTELELVIADKNDIIEDLNQVKTEYEDKCKELEIKLDELESLNESINQTKLELEHLNQDLKIRVSTLEPRQVIDTCKTNWTLYFAKRNLFLKNGRSLYIHVSFGYRNQRDIPKIIKDNIIYCIKNCPNGQVSRQGIVDQAYEQLRQCHAESCNCKENKACKYPYTVEFRLDLFCTKASYNSYKQRIRDALNTNNEAVLTEYLLQLQPKVNILEKLEDVCENIVEANNWYNSSCQYYY